MSYLLRKDRTEQRVRGFGLLAENYAQAAATNATIFVSQTVYYSLIGLLKGDVVTNVHYAVTVASSSSSNLFVGLYDSAGNRVALSSDLTTTKDAATGVITAALTAPYTVPADGAYFIAVLSVATTPPTCSRGTGAGGLYAGIGAGARLFGVQTGQTALPSTFTLSGSNNLATWMAVS